MDLLIEAVRATPTTTGWDLELLSGAASTALEHALVALASGVQSDLAAAAGGYPLPTDPYTTRMTAYDITLKVAYRAHTGKAHDDKYLLPTSSTTVKFGLKEPSIYIPKTGTWWRIDGAGYELALEPPGSSGLPLPLGDRYFLQIRPKDAVGECEYSVSTEVLSSDPRREERITEVNDKLRGVVLFFSHTRTRIVGIQSGPARSRGGLPAVRDPFDQDRNIWHYEQALQLSDDGTFALLRVRFVGDPPHLRAATLLTRDGDDSTAGTVACGDCDPPPTPPLTSPASAVAGLIGFGVTWAEEMSRRLCLISKVPGDIRPHLFFYELDYTSSPKGASGAAVIWLGGFLSNAYMARARMFDETGRVDLPMSAADLVAIQAELQVAGNLVLGGMRKYLNKGGGIDFDAVDDAFMRFARGELSAFDTHGVPNGVNMFAFAELACLSIRLGLDERTWRRLLDIFTRACEVFVRSYHKLGSTQRSICSYRVENNPLGRRGPDAAEMALIRDPWEYSTAEGRLSRLVHGALYDETRKEDHTPLQPVDFEPYVIPAIP